MNKLHVCCGDVYLDGYINIDIVGKIYLNGRENQNITTIDKYYKFPFKEGQPREFMVDKLMNILTLWDIESQSIDEIVMISAIEHFTKQEAAFIISEMKRVLKPDGRLIIDFPNIFEDVMNYFGTDDEFMMELIYCNQKNELSRHKWGYTRETFRNALGSGWKSIEYKTIVKHDYPMTGCLAIKE